MKEVKSSHHPAKGILAVFLIYFYFLEFAQFTFLHLLEQRVAGESGVKAVLGAMAAAGIGGSLLAVAARRRRLSWRLFFPGMLVCGLVALMTPQAAGLPAYLLLAALMGCALGLLTVTTAGLLPLLLPLRARGLAVGAGTGLAYAASNLPWLFGAPASARAFACGIVLLAGAPVFLRWWNAPAPEEAAAPAGQPGKPARPWAWTVLAFLLLIWLDSAVFYIIQENRALKEHSWEGGGQLMLNALVHLLAALAAGWSLDRGHRAILFPLAWLGLAAGAAGLQQLGWPAFTVPYVAGVSLYSCALVYLPSFRAATGGDMASFRRAAAVYAVAGWIGSGMGIGMAENLSGVPPAFIVVAGLLLLPVVKFSWQK